MPSVQLAQAALATKTMTAAGSSQSARARKRHRQRLNQKIRAASGHEGPIQLMRRSPTLSNALNAWLFYLRQGGQAAEYRSAGNFARVFKNECTRISKDYGNILPERQWISADVLISLIREFAGSFISEKNIERPSKIARVGTNLCSFIFFLGKHDMLPLADIETLHDYCADLGQSMIRSVRAERVGEAYSDWVRSAYTSNSVTADVENETLFKGGFEVGHVGRRFCLLRDFEDSDLDHIAFKRCDPVMVRFPLPMTRQLKNGDHLHLEIRRLRDSCIWVPTECYGVYPEGADDEDARLSQARTPTERSEAARKELDPQEISELLDRECQRLYGWGPADRLTDSLARMQVSNGGRRGYGRREYARRMSEDLPPDGFEEARFTDAYFATMETDIGDHDRGFGMWDDGSDASMSGEETE